MGGGPEAARCREDSDARRLRSAQPLRNSSADGIAARSRLGAAALQSARSPSRELVKTVQRAVGNRGLQRWLATYRSGPATAAPPAGNRVIARKTGITADAQSARYVQQATQLLGAAPPELLGAAMLFTRAFGKVKRFDLALQAALAFDQTGDANSAVQWYRRAIETTTGVGDRAEVQRLAREGLGRLSKTENPRYKHTIPVKLDYTLVTKATMLRLNPAWQSQDIRALKRAGGTREEISSADVLGPQRATLEKELLAAGTDDTARLAAQQRFRDALDKLRVTEADVPNYRVQYLRAAADRQRFSLGANGSHDLVQDGQTYDTNACYSKEAGAGWAIFVMSPDGDLFAAEHKVGRFHHSSFLAGGDAAAAGEIKVVAGKLKGLTNKSGHYAPSYQHMGQVLTELSTGLGQDLSGVELILHVGKKVRWKTMAAGFLALYNHDNMGPSKAVAKLWDEGESDQVEVVT
jgi:hypothetical protein